MVYLVIALVGLMIGLSKGGLGAPLVVMVTPLLSLVMPVQAAIGLSLPLLLIGDAVAIIAFWNTWDLSYIKQMLPPAIIGIVIGTTLLATLPDFTMRRILAVFIVIFIAYRLISERLKRLEYQPKRWHGYAVGGISGLASALANIGAPPFMAYMLLQPISPLVFVGTMTLFFALVNLLKLPGLMIAGLVDFNLLLQALWVIPVLIGSVFVGRWLVQRINKVWFERIMLGVLFIAAMVLWFVPPT